MGNRGAFLAATAILAAVVGHAVYAQRPERKLEVKIPGIDISLKTGWQLLFREGCRFAVPVSWRADADPDGSLARAPDWSNVTIRMFTVTSWSAHKAQVKAAFGRVNVMHEDTERRLWFEIGDKARVQHYVEVLNGLSVCSALLEIRTATTPDAADTTKRIVESIGPEPETWPSTAK